MSVAESFELLTQEDVEEIASRAWQNVSSHSTQYTPLKMLASLADLDDLPSGQLEFRAQLQFLMSADVSAFLRALPGMLTRLAQTSVSYQAQARVVTGRIDWPATMRLSWSRGPGSYVTSRNEAEHDVVENRLLKFMLTEVSSISDALLATTTEIGWRKEVRNSNAKVQRALRHPLVNGLPGQRGRAGYAAARASRTPGYRELARAYKLYDSLFRTGDSNELLRLFRDAILIPAMEDRAFELLVLFRVIDRLEASGARRRHIRLIGRGIGPTFSFTLGECDVHVHFQNVPVSFFAGSLYRRYLLGTTIAPGTRRPDLMLRVVTADSAERFLLIEAKCSARMDTIRDGAFQLLGYLSDFELRGSDASVLLVGYGPILKPASWPLPAIQYPFVGYVSDLDGLGEVLEQLDLCPSN